MLPFLNTRMILVIVVLLSPARLLAQDTTASTIASADSEPAHQEASRGDQVDLSREALERHLTTLEERIQSSVREFQQSAKFGGPDAEEPQHWQIKTEAFVRQMIRMKLKLQSLELESLERELELIRERIEAQRSNQEQLVASKMKTLFGEAVDPIEKDSSQSQTLQSDIEPASVPSRSPSADYVPVVPLPPSDEPLAMNAQAMVEAWRNMSLRQYELIETRQQELEDAVRKAEEQLQFVERDRDELIKTGDYDAYTKHWTEKLQRAQQGLERLAAMQKRDAQVRQFYVDTSVAQLRQAELAWAAAERTWKAMQMNLDEIDRLHEQGLVPSKQVQDKQIDVIHAEQKVVAARTAVQVWRAAIALMTEDGEQEEVNATSPQLR